MTVKSQKYNLNKLIFINLIKRMKVIKFKKEKFYLKLINYFKNIQCNTKFFYYYYHI
jgi:hypothetical protein